MMRLSASPLVRRMGDDDIPAVRALAATLRRWFSPHDLAHIDALLRERSSGWVALDASHELIGFLLDTPTPDPRVQELAWMAVAIPWQGKRIGTQLLEHLVADLQAKHVEAIEVSTVAESAGYAPYEATRAFYHARGFVDLRTDHDYYWPGGDRLVLRRALATGDTRA